MAYCEVKSSTQGIEGVAQHNLRQGHETGHILELVLHRLAARWVNLRNDHGNYGNEGDVEDEGDKKDGEDVDDDGDGEMQKSVNQSSVDQSTKTPPRRRRPPPGSLTQTLSPCPPPGSPPHPP